MDNGRILQLGTPDDIYLRPTSEFVATFVGETNRLAGTVVATSCASMRSSPCPSPSPSRSISGHRASSSAGDSCRMVGAAMRCGWVTPLRQFSNSLSGRALAKPRDPASWRDPEIRSGSPAGRRCPSRPPSSLTPFRPIWRRASSGAVGRRQQMGEQVAPPARPSPQGDP